MYALVYVDIDQGIHMGKQKIARNENRKQLCGFSYSKSVANFEVFRKVISSNINLLFLKSVLLLENPHFRSCMVDIKEIRTFRSNC